MTKLQWGILGSALGMLVCVFALFAVALSFSPMAQGGGPAVAAPCEEQSATQREQRSAAEISNFFDKKYGVTNWSIS